MYEEHWGLADKPFRNTPDPHYFFFSRAHEEALVRGLYAICEGQGAMLLTGDPGCGKTLILRVLLDELDPDRHEVALVNHADAGPDDFLRSVVAQFGAHPDPDADRPALWRWLEDFLYASRRRGATAVVCVDEAQIADDPATLERMRLLLNFQQDRRFGLTLLVAGQPELADLVAARPAFDQRLTVRWRVGPLSEDESVAYLRHRLSVAGGGEGVFTGGAERLIARAAGGVPRCLNRLADLALLAGYGRRAALVDEELAELAVADVETRPTVSVAPESAVDSQLFEQEELACPAQSARRP